mmetsp:Transcript_37122/g.94863  ORF Transcript_37122/g.94863 Transcript_37122/m.94863 type:complete len:120 (+) Transcript_37122:250-609(+)|eukprot:jgi/Tetstr1/442427/TSEL_030551.t1
MDPAAARAPPPQPTGSAPLPPLCDAAELALTGGSGHVCSRFCAIGHQFGNLYRCESSGTVHICDWNCDQRIFYDRYSTICRLSRRIFLNSDVEMEAQRKRLSEAAPAEADMQRKRSSGF